MSKLNSVNLVGNLTKDPKFFEQEDKSFIAKFSIATEYGYDAEKKENRVEFVPITAFGVSAAFMPYLKMGRKVSVIGRVGNDSYTDKEGKKVYNTTVKVSNGSLKLVDSPKKEEGAAY